MNTGHLDRIAIPATVLKRWELTGLEPATSGVTGSEA
jgi:hypothetical protein